MNFGALLALILRLAIPAVLTAETVYGDAVGGADKKKMATDALSGVTQAALSVLPGGSENAGYAQAASSLASEAIDAAVSFTKVTGQYQAATAAAAKAATATPAA